jgi:hypothetical protein
MPARISPAALIAIEDRIRALPEGASVNDLLGPKATPAQRRTLQRRLKHLLEEGRVVARGSARATRYFIPGNGSHVLTTDRAPDDRQQSLLVPLSKEGQTILAAVRQPIQRRKPVGYNRAFLDAYTPNSTFYLDVRERKRLAEAGTTDLPEQPAGTFAKQIMQRLLIDLSFNSSRLEGNTYSLLDTTRLLQLGEAPSGKAEKETQMILNHKDAIDFLVSDAEEIGFNRLTILNLHALLSNNLLADPAAAGALRWRPVGISGTSYHPPETPHLVSEIFDQLLSTVAAIDDPFEQAFFALVHLPYLQPFEDVNKRVSRLAANIPLIKNNLRPLSFLDVPDSTYVSGILGVYELNKVELLRDVFVWAYERSAQAYAAVRQSIGDPDPFRLRHREAIRSVVAHIISNALQKNEALAYLRSWTAQNIGAGEEERTRFIETLEQELIGLHEGNFARYRVRPSEFRAWAAAWTS